MVRAPLACAHACLPCSCAERAARARTRARAPSRHATRLPGWLAASTPRAHRPPARHAPPGTPRLAAGSYPYASYTPFKDTVPEDRLGLAAFKHVASLVRLRPRSRAGSLCPVANTPWPARAGLRRLGAPGAPGADCSCGSDSPHPSCPLPLHPPTHTCTAGLPLLWLLPPGRPRRHVLPPGALCGAHQPLGRRQRAAQRWVGYPGAGSVERAGLARTAPACWLLGWRRAWGGGPARVDGRRTPAPPFDEPDPLCAPCLLARPADDGESVIVKALRPINKGEVRGLGWVGALTRAAGWWVHSCSASARHARHCKVLPRTELTVLPTLCPACNRRFSTVRTNIGGVPLSGRSLRASAMRCCTQRPCMQVCCISLTPTLPANARAPADYQPGVVHRADMSLYIYG